MPKLCPKMMASMGISLVPVAAQGYWYEPSKVPTSVNPYNYPSLLYGSDGPRGGSGVPGEVLVALELVQIQGEPTRSGGGSV